MIPSDRLQLSRFHEERVDGEVTSARVKIEDTDSDRSWMTHVGRVDGDLVLTKFSDSATTAFERDAFPALWYALEECFERDIYIETDPLGAAPSGQGRSEAESVGDVSPDTTSDPPKSESESLSASASPAPATAVSDGGLVAATRHAPATITPIERPSGEWCLRCGAGPFESFAIHHGRVHGETEPLTLAAHPDSIVAESPIPRSRVTAVISTVESADSVREVMHGLAATDADQVRALLSEFDLVTLSNGTLRQGEGLQMRLDALREVVTDE